MLELFITNQYKKDLRRSCRQGHDTEALDNVIFMLLNEESLPIKHHDHELTGSWRGFREAHIEPDWLLIYEYPNSESLSLTRLGSHSELF